MMRQWRNSGLALGILGIGLAMASTSAAQTFPEKPVKLVVAYAAGGSVDILARVLAKLLSEDLGQPVIVENKPGAGGGVAAAALKATPADGYTLVSTTSVSLTFDPHSSNLGYGTDDFTYITALAGFQEAFVALPDRPFKDFKSLVAYAKGKQSVTFGSSTEIERLIAAAISRQDGIQLRPVPMRGGAEVMAQVLGGHVEFGYSAGIHNPHVAARKMIVLAALGEKRLIASPDVPTLKQLGYDFSSVNYNIVVAPKGLPPAVAKRLDQAFAKATKEQEFIDIVSKRQLEPLSIGMTELGKQMKAQSAAYAKLIAENK